jgi:lipoyl(octanoyl) transferase
MQIRLLPFAIADGATNMAADETLVRSAADEGTASLRFYGWSSATVSLGYFQSHLVRDADPLILSLPWVRRPSGGATLVHHYELTYALSLPKGRAWQQSESWLVRMHRMIMNALSALGLADRLRLVENSPVKHGDVLCFQQFTIGDVLCQGRKVIGSAQRKYRQALMQHGSILFSQSEFVPSLPGIRELTDVKLTPEQVSKEIVRQLQLATSWKVEEGDWSTSEATCILDLVRDRYGNAEWNERR